MKTKIDLHEIQVKILEVLLFKPKAKFSELNKEKLSTDQFNFHLKELIKNKLVAKREDGQYELTLQGKEFCGRFDTKNMTYEKQAKTGVVVVGVSTDKYLVQKRLKSPYYGYFGYITGKIKHGEKVLEAAERELWEEAGLEGKLRLAGIEHKMDYGKDNSILEDKFFYIVEATNLKGELEEEFKEGANVWMTREEISRLENKFDDMEIILKMIDKKIFSFEEHKFEVEGF